MIWHQAPCIDLTNRFKKIMALVQEVVVVPLIKENPLPVVSSVVDMVNTCLLKFHRMRFQQI